MRWQQIIFRAVLRCLQGGFDQRTLVEVFRIDLASVNRREHAKAVVSQTHVVTVTRRAGGNDAAAIDLAHQALVARMNELRRLRHLPNPADGFDWPLVRPKTFK